MGFTAAGINTSLVTTTVEGAQAPLGFELTVPDGDNGAQVWVYVFNDDTSGFVAGDVVVRDASTSTYDGILNTDTTAAVRVLGIAQHEIAAGSYGFILRKGIGVARAADTGDDQDDDPLVAAASGDATSSGVDVMAAGEEHCVIALGLANAGSSAGATFTVYVNVP